MPYLKLNQLIKIRFPSSLTKNYWTIEEKFKKTTFAVPTLAVMITIACSKPIKKEDLFSYLFSKNQKNLIKIEKTLQCLISNNVIFQSDFMPKLNSEISNWTNSNWSNAADYHFFTWDAPFLDYSKEGGGYELDRKNMVQFQKLEPDIQRYKSYIEFLDKIDLPSPSGLLNSLPTSTLSLFEKIKVLLALALGKKGEKSCYWSDTPVIRRTSPSGGSRHPTEGYFLSYMNQDIAKGWYHIQTEPPSLVFLSSLTQHPNFLKEDVPCLGAIVLTTVFERNMYRYREPRTFRTIHMDVGHLLETIELLGNELGFNTEIRMNFDENEILQQLNTSKLEEGVMAVILLQERV